MIANVLHPEIRNKLKLDPEAAEVVRRVFNEALKGDVYKRQASGLSLRLRRMTGCGILSDRSETRIAIWTGRPS